MSAFDFPAWAYILFSPKADPKIALHVETLEPQIAPAKIRQKPGPKVGSKRDGPRGKLIREPA